LLLAREATREIAVRGSREKREEGEDPEQDLGDVRAVFGDLGSCA
jgi:hypothetical protein